MMKNKKILVKGAYGEANFGDDLLMVTVERFLSSCKVGYSLDVLFVSNNQNLYCNKILNNYCFSHVFDLSKDDRFCDVMIYGGGTQFFDFGTPFYKRIIMLLSKPKYIFVKINNRFLNVNKIEISAKKTIALALGVGPFIKKRKSYYDLKKALVKWDFISVRDMVSKKYCEDLGGEGVILGADLCFSDFFTKNFLPVELKNKNKNKNKNKSIAVVVRDWQHDSEGSGYTKPLINFVEKNKNNFDFTFILFAKDKDKLWSSRLDQLSVKCLAWDPNEDNLSSFLSIFYGFDGYITARYHAGVLAALFNKPVICIEVEDKLKILVEQIPEFNFWRKGFSEEELYNLMSIFHADFDCVKSVNSLKKISNSMLEEVSVQLEKALNDE